MKQEYKTHTHTTNRRKVKHDKTQLTRCLLECKEMKEVKKRSSKGNIAQTDEHKGAKWMKWSRTKHCISMFKQYETIENILPI